MNKIDIIETALRVWGQETYKTTSLSHLAQALGVTKPALYRHFASKKDLMDGLYGYYCDHYVRFMQEPYAKGMENSDRNTGILLIVRAAAEYCARHKHIFIFSLFEVYGNKDREGDLLRQLAIRGMDIRKGRFFLDTDGYPYHSQLIHSTVLFLAALFHRGRQGNSDDPGEEEIQTFLSSTEGLISHGLGFVQNQAGAPDFRELEKNGNSMLPPEGENEGLLKAVAGAVAQAGPWNASMGMVAERSGLSKSGLFAHFKSKADMLVRMFSVEFDRIVQYAEMERSRSAKPEEQFYLAIVAIANYLRSRPEILIAMDWIRIRRLDLDISPPSRAYQLFPDIGINGTDLAGLSGETIAQWVFFLIISALMRRPEGSSFADVPDSSFRILYKFIAFGIEGWE
jgi:AcrR family transcriptional regulator